MQHSHVQSAQPAPVLGLGPNWQQFALLVAVNAFVGGMVGLERSILPLLAKEEFGIESSAAAVSFVASFGLAKAVTNLFAGHLSDRFTRKSVLLAGWLLGLPVPFVIIFAPSWSWIIGANVLLGLNQGLAWSMTVNMKVDLVGPQRRGFALGMNEAAGYLAVAAAAYLTGAIASQYGLRPEPFYMGIGFAAAGLALSALLVHDTGHFTRIESSAHPDSETPSLASTFAQTTWRDRRLFGVSQAGFVNNLNDGLAWGIFPLFFVSAGLDIGKVALLASAYPLIWGAGQLSTGWISDHTGRKPLIAGGLVLQGLAIWLVATLDTFTGWMLAVSLLGAGTAMAYPTLLAAISDLVHPRVRASSLGVYRFWRDGGAIVGALGAGLVADAFDLATAIKLVAVITVASGIIVLFTVKDTERR